MRIVPLPQETTSARALTYCCYLSFVPIGMATVILGPMLPPLSARWSMSYSQAGALILVQYVASTFAVGLSGMLAARRGFLFPMKTGFALMAFGLALLLSSSEAFALLGIAANGAGLGLAVPAANLLVASANPDRRSATLSLLNFFWSVGAVACPFLVAAAVDNRHIPLLLICLSAFSLLLVAIIALMASSSVGPSVVNDGKSPIVPLIRRRQNSFIILAVLFFLYVGVENGFGEWMASYAKSLGTLTLAVAIMTPSFFYASLTIGRLIAPAILRFVDEVALVRAGALLGGIGMGGLIVSNGLVGVAISATAAGLGLSVVYPITIALLSREFASARVGSVMFVLSNVGGGLLPWIVGVWSTKAGTLRAGLVVPLLGSMLMFMLFLRNWHPTVPDVSQSVSNDPGA